MNNEFDLYCVADVHGQLEFLLRLLEELDFKWPINGMVRDQLVVIGDVIDRGPSSLMALTTCLYNPAIIYIKGNHEDVACKAVLGGGFSSIATWLANGGEWHSDLDSYYLSSLIADLDNVPTAVTIRIKGKTLGFVHAGADKNYTWPQFTDLLNDPSCNKKHKIFALEDRTSFEDRDSIIEGVDAVVSGHNMIYPSFTPRIYGNRVFIDAGMSIGTRGLIWVVILLEYLTHIRFSVITVLPKLFGNNSGFAKPCLGTNLLFKYIGTSDTYTIFLTHNC